LFTESGKGRCSNRVTSNSDQSVTTKGIVQRYKALSDFTLYTQVMTRTGDVRVSQRGQMSLPASARHRWGLDEGGEVGYLDIGDAVILIPGGVTKLRRELLQRISKKDWQHARSGFGDRELANE
jgi:bifunctional DNA-binding transcriptional regulator/antitoxin component of YhaV-PrlF toxin-antitoxin module